MSAGALRVADEAEEGARGEVKDCVEHFIQR